MREIERKKAFCANCEKKFVNGQHIYCDLDDFFFCCPACILKFTGVKIEKVKITVKEAQKTV